MISWVCCASNSNYCCHVRQLKLYRKVKSQVLSEDNIYQFHHMNSELRRDKPVVESAKWSVLLEQQVWNRKTHSLLPWCVQQGERFRQRENRSHTRVVQGLWQKETISGSTFLSLTVLLLHVELADRKYVRVSTAALKVIFTPWHFNV